MRLATWLLLWFLVGMAAGVILPAVGLWALDLYGQVVAALAGVAR